MSTFYICATPIGNLSDVSQRLTETLKEVDVIYCEDTRRAAKLLNHLGIKKETRSYFLGNEVQKIEEIKNLLKSKKGDTYRQRYGCPGKLGVAPARKDRIELSDEEVAVLVVGKKQHIE